MFHHFNSKGQATGVYDFMIFRYIKSSENILVLGGTPYIYDDGIYHPDFTGTKLKTMIRKLIYPQFIKAPTIKRIYDLFISDEELQVKAEEMNQYPVEWICFKNGMLDPVNKEMRPHSPKYRAVNQIPHDFDLDYEPKGQLLKVWLWDCVCDKDQDSLEMLLQFSGLCLTRDTRSQKFLVLNGEGGSGKSTFIRLLELMIGRDNISNISLNQLSQRFAPFGLMGRLLNSCADLEINALEDTSTLKKVLGEDLISAEAKGKDAISFKSYAKLIFSTNELPIVKAERSNGFYRRLLIHEMNKVPEKPDTEFFDYLSKDIDLFIYMSVLALIRMYENGSITESERSREAVKRLRCESDTVEAFLNDVCERDPSKKIRKPDLFRKYESYCQDSERQSLSKNNFFRAMKTKGFRILKTGGIEYFQGIFFPKSSLNLPQQGWKSIDEDSSPF